MRLKYFQFVSVEPVVLWASFFSMLFVDHNFSCTGEGGSKALIRAWMATHWLRCWRQWRLMGQTGVGAIYGSASRSIRCFRLSIVSLYTGAIYRFAPHEKLTLLAYLPLIGGAFDLVKMAKSSPCWCNILT